MWYTKIYNYDRKESCYEIIRKTSNGYDRHRNHRDIPFGNFCQIFCGPFFGDCGIPPFVDGAPDDAGCSWKEKIPCRAQTDRPENRLSLWQRFCAQSAGAGKDAAARRKESV